MNHDGWSEFASMFSELLLPMWSCVELFGRKKHQLFWLCLVSILPHHKVYATLKPQTRHYLSSIMYGLNPHFVRFCPVVFSDLTGTSSEM